MKEKVTVWVAYASKMRLMTVLASDGLDARRQVARELDRPGRVGFFHRWLETGQVVRPE